MTPATRLHRVVQLAEPRPMTIEIHDHGCACDVCEPYRPSVPPRITGAGFFRMSALGVFGGVCGALALDPAGAARSIAATFGFGL